MIKSRIAAAAALLALASAANAGTSVTATWVSDYDWRGVMQTGGHDAVQLGATYTADSGLYAGLWGSSLIANNEIDEFVGFAGTAGPVGYDVGVNYYSYTNGKAANGYNPNYGELYAGVSWSVFAAKLWYAPEISNHGFGGKDGKDAFYLEGNAAVPVTGAEGLKLVAHVGYSNGDGIQAYYGGDKSYIDWSAGVSYDVGNFNTFLKYVDGSDNKAFYEDFGTKKVGSRFLFGVQTTLPWK